MRKRIRQLAKGKFEIEKPQLKFSENPLSFRVVEGKEYTGEFTITCTNHISLRGMVYCTDPRMTCLTPQFDGETVQIRYRYYGKGLEEGTKFCGNFVIICNQISCKLPYEGSVIKMYYESSVGTIHNMEDFTRLARENWKEAVHYFYHPSFAGLIGKSKKREQMIYRGLLSANNMNQSLEEFLIASSRKNQIHFAIDDRRLEFYEVLESSREAVNIRKDGWGYLEIEVKSDAPFLHIIKKTVSTEDFTGSGCRYEFLLDARSMREGKNTGHITFRSPYQQIIVTVTASSDIRGEQHKTKRKVSFSQNIREMLNLYLALRLKTKVTPVWARESLLCLEELRFFMDPSMYTVCRAFFYAVNRQKTESEQELGKFEEDNQEDEDRVSDAWMMDEYVHYLLEKNHGVRKKYRDNIEAIYRQDMEDDFLFWMVYSMQDDYKDNSVRLQVLQKRVQKGSNSPFLFIEVYSLFCENEFLLGELGSFEQKILFWAAAHGLMQKNIEARVFELADLSKVYAPKVYRLLERSCRKEENEERISVICRYLMKGHRFEPAVTEWYEKGIGYGLRITGLCEAYLQSLKEDEIISLPRIVQMYFQYECRLPYQKTAVLYSNIIAAKQTDPDLYMSYRKNMARFAMDQAEAGRISENLAVIYEDLLDPSMITGKMAHAMASSLYTCRLTVDDPSIIQVLVYQRQMKEPQVVPVSGGKAFFCLYSKDYAILLEDIRGRRFASTIPCTLTFMMDAGPYLNTCIQLAPDELSYILNFFSGTKDYKKLGTQSKISFDRFLSSEEIHSDYKAELIPEILKLYQGASQNQKMQKYLLTADFSKLSQKGRGYLLSLMISMQMYDLAYERIREFGGEQIDSFSRSKVYAYMIRKLTGESDDQLILLTAQTFLQGSSNEEMVRYLCANYAGPTDVMMDIWEHCGRFRINPFELEERILITALYGDEAVEKFSGVFRHYYETNGRELIIQAYLSSSSQRYFMKNISLDPFLFSLIQKRYLQHKEQSDACKLAILKYLSTLGKTDAAQKEMEDELLAEYTGRNMNFAFYRNLDPELILKYHLDDKVFLEYRAKPRTNVVVHVSSDEDGQEFRAEEMHEVYYGIYVKTFVLFFGELLRYYITEETGNKIELKESNRLMPEVSGDKQGGRYHMINQMLMSRILWEDDRLLKEMQRYKEADCAARNLFRPE